MPLFFYIMLVPFKLRLKMIKYVNTVTIIYFSQFLSYLINFQFFLIVNIHETNGQILMRSLFLMKRLFIFIYMLQWGCIFLVVKKIIILNPSQIIKISYLLNFQGIFYFLHLLFTQLQFINAGVFLYLRHLLNEEFILSIWGLRAFGNKYPVELMLFILLEQGIVVLFTHFFHNKKYKNNLKQRFNNTINKQIILWPAYCLVSLILYYLQAFFIHLFVILFYKMSKNRLSLLRALRKINEQSQKIEMKGQVKQATLYSKSLVLTVIFGFTAVGIYYHFISPKDVNLTEQAKLSLRMNEQKSIQEGFDLLRAKFQG